MLKRVENPELFFGLVAPIGVDLSETLKHLRASLDRFGYKTIPLKVTDIFREIDFCVSSFKIDRAKIDLKATCSMPP